MIRDIERKAGEEIGEELATLLERAKRIHTQQRKDKNMLYSVHAPEVECINPLSPLSDPSNGTPKRPTPTANS